MRIQLSQNFYLDEFTHSDVAVRHGIEIVVPEESVHFQRLKRLCASVLQPLRDHLGQPIIVTSGYRPIELNRLIGGSDKSQHTRCEAADFGVPGMKPIDICETIQFLRLPFDQLIHEFGRWVHVSIAPEDRAPRNEVLTSYKFKPTVGKPETRYIRGLHHIEELESAS